MGKGIKNRGSQVHKIKTKYNRKKKYNLEEDYISSQLEDKGKNEKHQTRKKAI